MIAVTVQHDGQGRVIRVDLTLEDDYTRISLDAGRRELYVTPGRFWDLLGGRLGPAVIPDRSGGGGVTIALPRNPLPQTPDSGGK